MSKEAVRSSTRSAERRDPALLLALAALFLILSIGAEPARGQSAGTDAQPADPAEDASAVAEARRLADAKRFAEAAILLRGALERDPENDAARSLLARVLAWDRRFDDSIDEYDRLLARRPADALERAGYARALAWSGRHEEAIREFRRAVAADPTNLETRVGYARALSWAGDLAGAHAEYRSVLRADPRYGDAWLGYATTARWRGAPTAADRFAAQAEALGADSEALAEERAAVDRALAASTGGGYVAARERQYIDQAPDFVIESSGPFAVARATLGRSVGVSVRGSWLASFEDNGSSAPGDTALNYDLRATVVRADASFLRGYPLQLSAGAEIRSLEAGSARVLYPLAGEDDFFGWNARLWGHAGRLTPSLAARREYLAIKSTTGPREILAGDQTVAEASLAWQWNGRGTASAFGAKGFYSDDNERTTVGAGAAYRIRMPVPSVSLDYGLSFSDWIKVSTSYFTPLRSVRHAAGIGMAGYAERAALDYGARYQFAIVSSDNFEDIGTHAWSGYLGLIAFDALPLGIEGAYSIDNNDYESWSVGISGSVRW